MVVTSNSLAELCRMDLPAMQAVMKQAALPARSALITTFVISFLRIGAMPMSAPSCMPMVLRPPIPHSTYVDISTERLCDDTLTS